MPTHRTILIAISMLFLISAGFYFSSKNNLEALVDNVGQAVSSSVGVASSTAPAITDCPYDTTELPEHAMALISEIAWMGDATSTKDEWIELANVSTSTVSIGGWELVDQSGKVKVIFRSGARIPTGGFYLLERGSGDFLGGTKADMFFVGTLKNTGDSFRLFDKQCALVDQVIAASGWPAGDNATKKTMERNAETLGWHTSLVAGGTPKAKNDQLVQTLSSSNRHPQK